MQQLPKKLKLNQGKLKKALAWLDIHGLFLLTAFLIIFIPLFPKIPLFDVLPGYIVRARLEDILILITSVVWLKDAFKKRFRVTTTYFWLVVFYALVGAVSLFLSTLLIKSIPLQLLHIGKSGLHLFRYLEYFSLFFFAYSSLKTQKQLKIILSLLVITLVGVVFYGFGQEYLHFPLYSTMNREYSKGVALYLQAGARPQSTFAGHYDLAAYLVIILPIIFSLSLSLLKIDLKKLKQSLKDKNNYLSLALQLVHLLGAWMLVSSGSKTALFAYLVAVGIVLLAYLRRLTSLKQQLKVASLALIVGLVSLTLFLNFFARSTKDQLISLAKNITTQTPQNPDAKPDDLVGDGVVFKQVVLKDEFGQEYKKWVKEQSTWSANSLKYGLSMGIRLDTLWPNALKGLINNPLFGNGYSTLAVINTPGAYSNADSTDNNFLRTLGETGLLGFISFYGLILVIAKEIYQQKTDSKLTQALKWGFFASIIGLLINAVYIDVFAASKVAYIFWSLAGFSLKALKVKPNKSLSKILKHISKHYPVYLATIFTLFLLHKNPFNKYALIRDLNVSNQQIESLVTAQCYLKTHSFNVCQSNGLILKNNPNLYSVLLLPFLIINSNPMMFYFLNLSLALGTIMLIYQLTPRLIKKLLKQETKKILLFTSLLIYILILTATGFTSKPLTSLELGLFLVVLPALIIIYSIIIHNIKFRLAYLTQISAVLLVCLFLINKNFKLTFLNQYRNDVISDKQATLNLANIHFDQESYLNRTKDSYLITTLNPYFVELFGNHHYQVLPLTNSQAYLAQVEKVYQLINNQEDLIKQYQKLVKTNNLYLSNYAVKTNKNYYQAFLEFKKQFDLSYIAIGCDDNCSLFSLSPVKKLLSPQPESITSKELNLAKLNNGYSFSVIANRYQPKTKLDKNKQQYYLNKFINLLKYKTNKNDDFLIVQGDVLDSNSKKSAQIFRQNYDRLPILYTPGNSDLLATKYYPTQDSYFYTDSEFFIILNTNPDSEISAQQQRFVYNALLKLEKLKNIKSIFIISYNLNWQDRSNPANFISKLETKLAEFNNLDKYIITSYHSKLEGKDQRSELTAKDIYNKDTRTHYLASIVRDWDNDTFLEFSINPDKSVTVNYKVKGLNF